MKKLLVFVLTLLLCFSVASAEALSGMSLDELYQLRDEVNAAIGAALKAGQASDDGTVLGKIIDLFPDEQFAMYVRDEAGKISINQTVTQAGLDRVKNVYNGEYTMHDLTGIKYLRNVEWISVSGDFKDPHAYTLSIPDELHNLTKLYRFYAAYTSLAEIPESIGCCVSLKDFDINSTKVTSLPDSMWSLELETVDLAGTPIK